MTARLASLADRTRRLALSIAGGNIRSRPGATLGTWYKINTANPERAIVVLDGEIGWDVVSSAFARDLNEITAPYIDLQINSPGGSVWDGYAIYNALKMHPAIVTAHILGVAASAASFIAMAAEEIVAYRPSEMMIHDAAGYVDIWAMANPAELARIVAELDDLRASLDLTSDEIAAIYARKAGGSVAEWRGRMTATTWYNPDEALAAGLVDRINGEDASTTTDTPAPGDPGATDGAPIRVADIIRARHTLRLAREGVS